jgi:hypothetical protein
VAINQSINQFKPETAVDTFGGRSENWGNKSLKRREKTRQSVEEGEQPE